MGRKVKVGTPRAQRHGAGQRLPSRWRVCVCFAVGLLAALAALAGLAYLNGAKPAGANTLAGALEATLRLPAVTAPAAVAVLLWGGWCVRNLRFEWLAWWPGNVEIPALKAPSSPQGVEVEWLTGVLRERLAQLSLQAPTSVPGAAAEGSYLDVLSDTSIDPRNPLSLLKMARAAWPSHAYKVEAALRSETTRGATTYMVRAQVTRLPHESSTLVSGEGSSWEEAVHRAADEATAVILPRTRLCRGQWSGWRRYVMPEGLLGAYERATKHELEGARMGKLALNRAEDAPPPAQYGQALQCYYEALDLDPFNLAIRLRVGQLQEKMGLELQALATYQAIVAVTRPADEDLPPSLYSRRARRERGEAIMIARYRRAVLLGGDGVASQWGERGDGTGQLKMRLARLIAKEADSCASKFVLEKPWSEEEARDRGRHREPLTAPLGEPRMPTGMTLAAFTEWLVLEKRGTASIGDLLQSGAAGAKPLEEGEVAVMRLVLAAIGYATSQELLYDRRVRRLLRHGAVRTLLRRSRTPSLAPFTLKTLRLSQLCIQLRLSRALHDLIGEGREDEWARLACEVVERVEEVIDKRVRQWHEGYNAACACAIPLIFGVDAGQERRVSRASIEWLERATACADSGYAAGQDEWVRSDPDLLGLRDQQEFIVWERVYFPDTRLLAADGSGAGRGRAGRS